MSRVGCLRRAAHGGRSYVRCAQLSAACRKRHLHETRGEGSTVSMMILAPRTMVIVDIAARKVVICPATWTNSHIHNPTNKLDKYILLSSIKRHCQSSCRRPSSRVGKRCKKQHVKCNITNDPTSTNVYNSRTIISLKLICNTTLKIYPSSQANIYHLESYRARLCATSPSSG